VPLWGAKTAAGHQPSGPPNMQHLQPHFSYTERKLAWFSDQVYDLLLHFPANIRIISNLVWATTYDDDKIRLKLKTST